MFATPFVALILVVLILRSTNPQDAAVWATALGGSGGVLLFLFWYMRTLKLRRARRL